MKIAPIADIKANFSEFLRKAQKGPVVVTKNGRPIAVLLGLKDEEEIERLLLGYSIEFQALLERGRQQIRKTGGTDHDRFWEEVENAD
jgi:prevent-host-death family protein